MTCNLNPNYIKVYLSVRVCVYACVCAHMCVCVHLQTCILKMALNFSSQGNAEENGTFAWRYTAVRRFFLQLITIAFAFRALINAALMGK